MLALTLTITSWWWIPAVITLVSLICIILAWTDKSDTYGLGAMIGTFVGLIPILLAWLIYFIIN